MRAASHGLRECCYSKKPGTADAMPGFCFFLQSLFTDSALRPLRRVLTCVYDRGYQTALRVDLRSACFC